MHTLQLLLVVLLNFSNSIIEARDIKLKLLENYQGGIKLNQDVLCAGWLSKKEYQEYNRFALGY